MSPYAIGTTSVDWHSGQKAVEPAGAIGHPSPDPDPLATGSLPGFASVGLALSRMYGLAVTSGTYIATLAGP
jgi:hypothetical protein